MSTARPWLPVLVRVEQTDAHDRRDAPRTTHHGQPQPTDLTVYLHLTVEPPPDAKPQVIAQPVEILVGDRRYRLTPREAAVVGLLADGLTDEGVARELRLSKRTVSHAISGLMRRLGATNRFQLGWILGTVQSM